MPFARTNSRVPEPSRDDKTIYTLQLHLVEGGEAIHDHRKTWMPETSPGMTERNELVITGLPRQSIEKRFLRRLMDGRVEPGHDS
jgi:predicted amidohydrolase